MKKDPISDRQSQNLPAVSNFVLYTSKTGDVEVGVYFKNETVWLTQKAMGELFGKDRSVITKHLKNIFKSGELVEDSVCAFFAQTAADGKTYNTKWRRSQKTGQYDKL